MLSLFISIIFSIIGIYFTVQYGTRNRLRFVEEGAIQLSKIGILSQHIHFPDINQENINRCILLKFSIDNNGRSDIDKNDLYESVIMNFANVEKIVSVSIENTNQKINPIIEQNINSLSIKWDLLKSHERIIFYVVLLTENNTIFERDSITISARIKNIKRVNRKVDTINSDERKEVYNWNYKLVFMITIMLVTIGLSQLPQSKYKIALYDTNNNNIGYVTTYNDKEIRLVDGKNKAIYNNQNVTIHIEYKQSKINEYVIIAYSVCLLLIVFLQIKINVDYQKKRKKYFLDLPVINK